MKFSFVILASFWIGHFAGCDHKKAPSITHADDRASTVKPVVDLEDKTVVEPKPEPVVDEKDERVEMEFEWEEGKLIEAKNGITLFVNNTINDYYLGGGTSSSWEIVITKGAELHEIEYTFGRDHPIWHVEGIAFGYVFVIFEDDEDQKKRKVILTPTNDTAMDMADEKEQGFGFAKAILDENECKGTLTWGETLGSGTYAMSRFSDDGHKCTVAVGVYTRQVLAFRKWTVEEEEAIEKKRQEELERRRSIVHLTRAMVIEAIGPAVDKVKECGKGNIGALKVRITIAPSGKVKQAQAVDTWAGTPEGICAEKVVRKVRFPRFDGDDVTVTYPFRL